MKKILLQFLILKNVYFLCQFFRTSYENSNLNPSIICHSFISQYRFSENRFFCSPEVLFPLVGPAKMQCLLQFGNLVKILAAAFLPISTFLLHSRLTTCQDFDLGRVLQFCAKLFFEVNQACSHSRKDIYSIHSQGWQKLKDPKNKVLRIFSSSIYIASNDIRHNYVHLPNWSM